MGGPIVIARLTPSNMSDFLRFFDEVAFTNNPQWASCYCQCYYEDHQQVRWSERTAEQNRQRACERITNGEMRGCLAFSGNEVVGWCSAAPRALVHALDTDSVADGSKIGVVTCFLVAPSFRGQGIARKLLDAAEQMLREEGLVWFEGNPRAAETSDPGNHHGPLALYVKAGFMVARTDRSDNSIWMRKAL